MRRQGIVVRPLTGHPGIVVVTKEAEDRGGNFGGIWDNRCTLHYAVNDYHGRRRETWRISIAGTRPA